VRPRAIGSVCTSRCAPQFRGHAPPRPRDPIARPPDGDHVTAPAHRPEPGDLNADGLIDQTDVGALVRALAETDPSLRPASADVNGDAVVNRLDLETLLATPR
jgi:hypothetical protein